MEKVRARWHRRFAKRPCTKEVCCNVNSYVNAGKYNCDAVFSINHLKKPMVVAVKT